MKNEIIDKILETEKKANKIIFDATLKANEIVEQSFVINQDARENCQNQSKIYYKKLMDKIEKEQEKNFVNKMHKLDEKNSLLVEKAKLNYDKTIEILVRGVLNGNS